MPHDDPDDSPAPEAQAPGDAPPAGPIDPDGLVDLDAAAPARPPGPPAPPPPPAAARPPKGKGKGHRRKGDPPPPPLAPAGVPANPAEMSLVDLDSPAPAPAPAAPEPPPVAEARPAAAVAAPPGGMDLEDLDPPGPTISSAEPEGVEVQIRHPGGLIKSLWSEAIRPFAKVWPDIVRNRERWSKTGGGYAEMMESSREVFRAIGLTDEDLGAIGRARLVEVSIPFRFESEGWAARIFPWEVMLSAATKPDRGDDSLWVVRHLDRLAPGGGTPAEARPLGGLKALYIQSNPRELRGWGFVRERERVIEGLPGFAYAEAIDLARLELREKVAAESPGLIHVAGFDTWQAAALLGLPYSPRRRDGLMLTTRSGDPDEVGAEELSGFLAALDLRPWLVSLNVYNSAARLAPIVVAGGAGAAVGFQDSFDDSLAELFFSRFYEALARPKGGPAGAAEAGRGEDRPPGDVLDAFLRAQAAIRTGSERIVGSGLVLWRERGLVPSDAAAIPRRGPESGGPTDGSRVGGDPGPPPPPPGGEVDGDDGDPAPPPPPPPPSAGVEGWPFLLDSIKPFQKLNYSMLHNRSVIFEEFVLRRKPGQSAPFSMVTVRVELYLAAPSPCSWERTFDVPAAEERRLHEEIRLPLISDLQRSLRNSLRTNIKVRIEYDGRCYQETFPVELLAIDEWRDDDSLAQAWLPSFVMPGDAAVPKVVDDAQRYLVTLLDRASAGFDGYQGLRPVELSPGRPSSRPPTPEEVIDPQARAIWAALWLDNPLRYINQLPTQTKRSQRIRSPSMVLKERRGTCIDLALLYASCLEQVDLLPVIFLLRGHALPGYWRDRDLWEEFTVGLGPDEGQPATGGTSVRNQMERWVFKASYFPMIRSLIESGALVPVETTLLTSPEEGFFRAMGEGARRTLDEDLFESMMDVRLAREHGVTPLPMISEYPR